MKKAIAGAWASVWRAVVGSDWPAAPDRARTRGGTPGTTTTVPRSRSPSGTAGRAARRPRHRAEASSTSSARRTRTSVREERAAGGADIAAKMPLASRPARDRMSRYRTASDLATYAAQELARSRPTTSSRTSATPPTTSRRASTTKGNYNDAQYAVPVERHAARASTSTRPCCGKAWHHRDSQPTWRATWTRSRSSRPPASRASGWTATSSPGTFEFESLIWQFGGAALQRRRHGGHVQLRGGRRGAHLDDRPHQGRLQQPGQRRAGRQHQGPARRGRPAFN